MKLQLIPEPWRVTVLEQWTDDGPFSEKINPELGKEEYRVLITVRERSLEGGSPQALCYARATLEQIRFQCAGRLPLCFIEDKPEVSLRSFHIDSVRHFFSMDELKKMISTAAAFKFNYFHWHFSDDQGFRIECRRYPKLHELGSVRKGDHFGNYSSDAEEGGYYTRKEVQELVSFCAELGITVIPEIDFPGHTSAILHAYPELSCDGRPVEVKTSGGIFYDLICAAKEESYDFIFGLLDDMMELFPGPYFHIGGDEAPKTAWENCPACQAMMKEKGFSNMRELQGAFENRLIAYLKEKGKTAIVWNDAAFGGNLDSGAMLQLWTKDRTKAVPAYIERGGKVLYSPFRHAYCDYPFGLQTLRDIYALETAPKQLRTGEVNALAGTECLIWTEYIRTEERLENYAWPRFCASAEASWCGSRKGSYKAFTARMKALLPFLEARGIRPMPPEGWRRFSLSTLRDSFAFLKNFDKKMRRASVTVHKDI